MFKNKNLKWVIILGFALAAAYSLTSSSETYADQVNEAREAYQNTLENLEPSPLAQLEDFNGFNYFEADENYKITAEFLTDPSTKTFPLSMTDGSLEPIEMAGYAVFTVNGVEFKVMLFDEGENFLLPFTDETNDQETYGGGRYINVTKSNNNRLEIDFNRAHNFYCVYNTDFVCPIPPSENDLAVRIAAGEKLL